MSNHETHGTHEMDEDQILFGTINKQNTKDLFDELSCIFMP